MSTEIKEKRTKYPDGINTADSLGRTPLHWAACGGGMAAVKRIISSGGNVHAEDGFLLTPLHFAALHGRFEAGTALTEAGASPEAKDKSGWTPIHWAASQDHASLVEYLSHAGGFHKQCRYPVDEIMRTPLHVAAANGGRSVIELYARYRYDLNPKDLEGRAPIHYTVGSDHPECLETLLRLDCDPNTKDGGGATPLHYAAFLEKRKIVDALVKDGGADPNSGDNQGGTPLHWLVEKGTTGTARELIDHGADPRLRDSKGKTCLHWAVEQDEPRLDLIRVLLTSGADPGVGDEDQRTPLHYLAATGLETATQVILDAGGDPAPRDIEGIEPIHFAAFCGYTGYVSVIHRAGASLDSKDQLGRTPLIWAVGGGHADLVRWLLHSGADANAQDGDLWTALDWAFDSRPDDNEDEIAQAGFDECIRILTESKAFRGRGMHRGQAVPPVFPTSTSGKLTAVQSSPTRRRRSSIVSVQSFTRRRRSAVSANMRARRTSLGGELQLPTLMTLASARCASRQSIQQLNQWNEDVDGDVGNSSKVETEVVVASPRLGAEEVKKTGATNDSPQLEDCAARFAGSKEVDRPRTVPETAHSPLYSASRPSSFQHQREGTRSFFGQSLEEKTTAIAEVLSKHTPTFKLGLLGSFCVPWAVLSRHIVESGGPDNVSERDLKAIFGPFSSGRAEGVTKPGLDAMLASTPRSGRTTERNREIIGGVLSTKGSQPELIMRWLNAGGASPTAQWLGVSEALKECGVRDMSLGEIRAAFQPPGVLFDPSEGQLTLTALATLMGWRTSSPRKESARNASTGSVDGIRVFVQGRFTSADDTFNWLDQARSGIASWDHVAAMLSQSVGQILSQRDVQDHFYPFRGSCSPRMWDQGLVLSVLAAYFDAYPLGMLDRSPPCRPPVSRSSSWRAASSVTVERSDRINFARDKSRHDRDVSASWLGRDDVGLTPMYLEQFMNHGKPESGPSPTLRTFWPLASRIGVVRSRRGGEAPLSGFEVRSSALPAQRLDMHHNQQPRAPSSRGYQRIRSRLKVHLGLPV